MNAGAAVDWPHTAHGQAGADGPPPVDGAAMDTAAMDTAPSDRAAGYRLVMVHLDPYTGAPRALAGLRVASAVFEDAGVDPRQDTALHGSSAEVTG
ncbi:hypothetical protein [Actinacidiphila rubida]|uniref:Uncharacterized protein n=1 Tax=Actinacidiphila rubida TaxID=310780 RepID=A0A1H8QDB4_9ACTN|nr:hypothetical protein [Actinacidiphila rubida]SEO51874.1 hypothetical protein SAMN05216267_102941 [Actinacidiphila rubida]